MKRDVPIVVHLVHGTWPFGIFRKGPGKLKAWFEEGSEFRNSIIDASGEDLDVREFLWSGKNSAVARAAAAQALLTHVESALRERPNSKHIIIAHSHGGTVAAHMLSSLRFPLASTPKIMALVCLATPFAYIIRESEDSMFRFWNALGVLITSLWLLTYIITIDDPLLINGLYLAIGWGVTNLLVGAVLHVLGSFYSGGLCTSLYRGAAIPSCIPVFLIRATRDEAALLLGFVQATNKIIEFIYSAWDDWVGLGGFLTNILIFSLSVPFCLILSNILFFSLFRYYEPPVWEISIVAFFIFCIMMSLLVLCGRALVNLSVGLSLRWWPNYAVEVDAAPPDTVCNFKAYSEFGSRTLAMRHGIYELIEVQQEIGHLIGRVAKGYPPRLFRHHDLER